MPNATQVVVDSTNDAQIPFHARRSLTIVIGDDMNSATPINLEGVTWAGVMPTTANALNGRTLSFFSSHVPTPGAGQLATCYKKASADNTLEQVQIEAATGSPMIPIPPEAMIGQWLFITTNAEVPARLFLFY